MLSSSRIFRRRVLLVVAPLVLLLLLLPLLSTAAVEEVKMLAMDLGSQSTKAAVYTVSYAEDSNTQNLVATPEVRLVLNDQTNRKWPTCVAFRRFKKTRQGEGDHPSTSLERYYAEPAEALLYRFPSQTACHINSMFSSPQESDRADGEAGGGSRYRTLTLLPHPNRSASLVQLTQDDVHSPEELLGMIVRDTKRLAEKSLLERNRLPATVVQSLIAKATGGDGAAATLDGDEVHGTSHPVQAARFATFTVPIMMSVAERQAVMDAAAISGLRTTRLVSSSTAALYQLMNMKGNQWLSIALDQRGGKRKGSKAPEHAQEQPPSGDSAEVKPSPSFFERGQQEQQQDERDEDDAPLLNRVGTGKEMYVMVFQMGYQYTEAAVYRLYRMPPSLQAAAGSIIDSYQSSTREGKNSAVPELVAERVASASSATVGGYAMDVAIAEYWEKQLLGRSVLQQQPGSSDAAEWLKDRTALLRAAEDARERLSVNNEVPVHIERLRDANGKPFSTVLSRDTFEKICRGHIDQAVELAVKAWKKTLRRSGVNSSGQQLQDAPALQRIDVVGGATRTPRLLAELESSGIGLSSIEAPLVHQILNADEASVVGAAHFATASLRSVLRVQGSLWVREPCDHRIFFAATPVLPSTSSSSGHGAPLKLLFDIDGPSLPLLYSVRFDDRVEDFTFSMFASPTGVSVVKGRKRMEEEREWLQGVVDSSSAVPTGVFAQHFRIVGVERAMAAMKEAMERDSGVHNATQKQKKELVRYSALNYTVDGGADGGVVVPHQVVVEVSLTDSGIPRIQKAYMEISAVREVFTAAPTPPSASPSSEEEEEEGVSSSGDGDDHQEEEAAPPSISQLEVDEEEDPNIEPEWVLQSTNYVNHTFQLAVVMDDKSTTDQVQHNVVGSNMPLEEMVVARSRLALLEKHDREAQRCRHLLNSIQSVLSSIRTSSLWEKMTAAEDVDGSSTDDHPDALTTAWKAWKKEVQETDWWLEGDGEEEEDPAVLSECLHRLERIHNEIVAAGEGKE